MKQLHNAFHLPDMLKNVTSAQIWYEKVNLYFSSKYLERLRELTDGNVVSTQDSLTAYLAVTLNTHCYSQDNQRLI